ncbi:hypothetical protein LXA47_23075 [Massilia sp. P8910]|uniref:hypothetical protein n=1 Tax=Massilia antarctica TaxID=2765360 RepID=UPI000A805E5F|nr:MULTISPECIES: hypothetical protein [Massilia]MCE3606467.1 hypothetical protein [Massilia antarctica]MCY0915113.1 hypothetical protein [Massilia sp. H27-R4]
MSAATVPQPGAPAVDAVRRANEEATMRALARGDAVLAKWIQDRVLVDTNAVAHAWNISSQAVHAARKRGEIFAVWANGKHWYAREALRFERGKLARINRTLGDVDPSSKLLFFLRQHGALGGRIVADAIAGGDLDDVLRLARNWART